MKGKKSDPIFISSFIQESVKEGATTPDEIVSRAKRMIAEIDEEIRAIEEKKKTRSKLLDVIIAFDKTGVKDKAEEAKLLPYFNLQYPNICKQICNILSHRSTFEMFKIESAESKFAVKQLLELKIVNRVHDNLICGDNFNEYWSFVLREDK
jgi:hypothetical protein